MKTRIAIVGTGGVGGFIGGKLALHYEGNPDTEICFISRGEALQAIRERGLIVDTLEGSFTARPKLATDSAADIGPVDYLLFCTKAYDVEQAVRQVMPCIGPRTVVLPFLNGVDSTEKIRQMLPANEVWDGCVYIVAYIVAPGRIAERTNGYRYLFGYPGSMDGRPAELEAALTAAGVRARVAPDIVRRVWDKFAFISTVATITSYTDETYGGVLGDPSLKTDLLALLSEFRAVAAARGVGLSERITEEVVTQMERIPADTTTSMQRDFRAGRNTELESLTGYVVREGERLGVPVPAYRRMYEGLRSHLAR